MAKLSRRDPRSTKKPWLVVEFDDEKSARLFRTQFERRYPEATTDRVGVMFHTNGTREQVLDVLDRTQLIGLIGGWRSYGSR